MKHFGYGIEDFIPCEVCGERAVDVHHIEARGMGASKRIDHNAINNLMALCRKDHIEYGDKKQHLEFLKEIHQQKL